MFAAAAPYLALLVIVAGLLLSLLLPTNIDSTSSFPTAVLATAWPVDVGLMVGALTLGMVRIQTQYNGPARGVVYKYALHQARLIPVVWIGATSNGLLLMLLLDWLYRNGVSWTMIDLSLATTGALIIASVWSFIGTVQSMNPLNELKLKENALREMVAQAVLRMSYVIAFREVLTDILEPLHIVVPEIEIALDSNTFKNFRAGYIRHVWFWRLDAVKTRLDLNSLPPKELENGVAGLFIPVDRQLKRGQFLGMRILRDLDVLRQHTVMWLGRASNKRIETLRNEVIRLLDNIGRNPDGDVEVLDDLLAILRLLTEAVIQVEINASRWIPVFDGALHQAAQAISGRKLQEYLVKYLITNLNGEPSESLTGIS